MAQVWRPSEVRLEAQARVPSVKPLALSIRTDPPNASVIFVASAQQYREGMALPPGTYRIRLSAPGYQSKEIEFTHAPAADSDVATYEFALQRLQ